MNYVRTSNGDTVPAGVVVDESTAAKLWRLPLKLLPKDLAENPRLALAVAVLPFGAWALLAWFLWRRLSHFHR